MMNYNSETQEIARSSVVLLHIQSYVSTLISLELYGKQTNITTQNSIVSIQCSDIISQYTIYYEYIYRHQYFSILRVCMSIDLWSITKCFNYKPQIIGVLPPSHKTTQMFINTEMLRLQYTFSLSRLLTLAKDEIHWIIKHSNVTLPKG